MSKLILVRHGKSIFNQENSLTDGRMSMWPPKGYKKRKRQRKSSKKNDLHIDICFSSYLKRAIRTSWIILDETDAMMVDCLHGWKLNLLEHNTMN